jgi:hypothetical protein
MGENMYPHRRFCKESTCMHYNLIDRLTSMQDSTKERDLEIARVHCQQACEKTAYNYYEWLRKHGINP